MNSGLPVHIVFLSLGSNLGNRKAYLEAAIEQIGIRIGIVYARSGIYETTPWGFESKQAFLNMAVGVKTRLLPKQVLYITQAIERELGRKEKSQGSYRDRVIDIDLIIYDKLTMHTPELTLPHPLYKERDFVMKPLSEIISVSTS